MISSFNLFKKSSAAFCLAAVMLLSGCGDPKPVSASGDRFSSRFASRGEEVPESSVKTSGADLYNISVYLSRDPRNTRNIRFDDGVLTISGMAGDQGIEGVSADFPANVDYKRSGNTFICTVTCTSSGRGYGTIELKNARFRTNYIRVRFTENGLSFPNTLTIAEANRKLVEADIPEDSESVTLSYITMSGDKQRAREILDDVKELSDKICQGLTDDYDRLRAISRWVSENIYYDHPAFSAGIPQRCLTLEYILENRSGVCGSYANLTSALCQAQGILCYNIKGEGISGRTSYAEQTAGDIHEWNYAFMGGRGIWVDSGWNSSCHLYSDGSRVDGDISLRYFDVGNECFSIDHKARIAANRDFFDPDLLV